MKGSKRENQEGISAKGAEGKTTGSISSVTQRDQDDSSKKSFKENREKNTMSVSEWRKGQNKEMEGDSDGDKKSSLTNKKNVSDNEDKTDDND